MKKVEKCSYCWDEVDTNKRAFVYSPKSGECIHLRCFTSHLTYDISRGLQSILKDEGEQMRKVIKKEKKKRKKTVCH